MTIEEVKNNWPDDFEYDEYYVDYIAKLLKSMRVESCEGSCLDFNGGGVKPFIRNRLLELEPFYSDQNDDNNDRLVVVLHFWPWDKEKYGEFHDCDLREFFSKSRKKLVESKSPISKIVEENAVPINKQAYDVSKRY